MKAGGNGAIGDPQGFPQKSVVIPVSSGTSSTPQTAACGLGGPPAAPCGAGRCQTARKPGSVPPQIARRAYGGGDGHSSGTPVTGRLVRPTRAAARRSARHLGIAPGCLPLLLGLAPGGVFPAAAVAGGAVRSYRTVSPLPPARACRGRARRYTFCGTFPGVAPAGRYPAPYLRGARTFLSPHGGEERPSGRLATQIWPARPPLSKAARSNARGHGLVVMPTAAANSFFTFPPNSGLTRRVVLPALASTAVGHAM